MALNSSVPRNWWNATSPNTRKKQQQQRIALSFGDGQNSRNHSSSSLSSSPRQIGDEALEWFSGQPSSSFSSTTDGGNSNSNNNNNNTTSTTLSWKSLLAVILLVALSWTAASHTTHQTLLLLRQLQDKEARYRLHLTHSYESLDQSRQAYKQETALLKKWRKTKDALEHEIRVMSELAEADVQLYPLPERPPAAIVTEWLMHRQAGLQRQVDTMARYLQRTSKETVLERYGPGPHRVKFTAELDNKLKSSFIVELFPLDVMPHSVHFFLDLVNARVWDDTVFLHHEAVEHLLATAPIDFYTQKVKHSNLHKMGWDSLGFPEHVEEYPHDKYTLGFAGQGPTFYINTIDNSYIHGPGSQGHHLLPQDADPCFAKVVEGHDVVDALIAFGLQQTTDTDAAAYGGATSSTLDGNNGQAWTHIVSVELLPRGRENKK